MRFFTFIAFLVALVLPASANAYDDPKALVTAIYAPYLSSQQHPDLNPFYSARLKQLFADHAGRVTAAQLVANGGQAEASADIGFNPFIDGKNALLLDLVIGEPAIIGDRALLTVSFHNFDQPSLLSIAVVKEADGWKVDDVSSMGSGEHWMLSWLLQYDPWS